MHNYLARLHYAAKIALLQYGHVKYLQSAIDGFLKYLLFTEETQLAAPINGSSEFAKEFAAAGPKDSKGRSLRDFDLQTRMFKYPCSYLIYSEAFDELPQPLKEAIYRRLFEILSGKDKEFESSPPDTKLAILEILRDTKAGLPAYWK
jgi:hypothetical protein